MLAAQRPLLSSRATLTEALEPIMGITHRLSEAAGIYGFADNQGACMLAVRKKSSAFH